LEFYFENAFQVINDEDANECGVARYNCMKCSAKNKVRLENNILNEIQKKKEFQQQQPLQLKSKEILKYFWSRYPYWKMGVYAYYSYQYLFLIVCWLVVVVFV
jgi:hypothetical protein